MTGRRRARIGRAAAVAAACLAGHIALFAAMFATRRPELTAAAPVIEVELLRPPPPEGARAERPAPAALRAPAPPLPFRRPRLTGPAPAETVAVVPAPPAPPPPPPPAAAPPPDDVLARIADALAAAGECDPNRLAALAPGQQARCRERAGAAARNAERMQTPAERRAEAARARAAAAKGPALVRGPGDAPGSHPALGPPPVMVGVSVPFGKPPKALPPIPPSTLRGDDDALRPKPSPGG
jgi:hypothetical protein